MKLNYTLECYLVGIKTQNLLLLFAFLWNDCLKVKNKGQNLHLNWDILRKKMLICDLYHCSVLFFFFFWRWKNQTSEKNARNANKLRKYLAWSTFQISVFMPFQENKLCFIIGPFNHVKSPLKKNKMKSPLTMKMGIRFWLV